MTNFLLIALSFQISNKLQLLLYEVKMLKLYWYFSSGTFWNENRSVEVRLSPCLVAISSLLLLLSMTWVDVTVRSSINRWVFNKTLTWCDTTTCPPHNKAVRLSFLQAGVCRLSTASSRFLVATVVSREPAATSVHTLSSSSSSRHTWTWRRCCSASSRAHIYDDGLC